MRRHSSTAISRRAVLAGTLCLCAARPVLARNIFALTAAEGEIVLVPGETALHGPLLNGAAVGPALNLELGKPFSFSVTNNLAFPLSFCPQGLGTRGDNAENIAPGETRSLSLTARDAGSFAYRLETDDAALATRTLLLSGAIIVADTGDADFAEQDIVAALNTLALPSANAGAPPHRIVTVNGTPGLQISARPAERLRLRLVNIAAESPAALKLPAAARIVAMDGLPCPPFSPNEGLLLMPPFARVDIIVDMPGDAEALTILDDLEPDHVLVRIIPKGEAVPARPRPDALVENPRLPKQIAFEKALRPEIRIGTAAPDPLIRAGAGQTIILSVVNGLALHGLMLDRQTARLLDNLDDGWKPWWHDTLILFPGETSRLAFVPEEPGRYSVTIVPLEGDGATTRAWFEVS
ncbi:hypothetical protein [Terrihabitans sp. B22-R8]|uniref:hypothetical protein n=1 Tax=Terrihabitans sp. B22-R8 TaxID=3425128 RepID=UPI00403C06F4